MQEVTSSNLVFSTIKTGPSFDGPVFQCMFPPVSAAPGTNGTKASVPASTRNISDNSAEKPRQQPKTTKRNIRPSLRTAGYAQRCRKALFVPEKSRDERRFEQVIGAFADAAHDVVVARTFDLDDDVLHAGGRGKGGGVKVAKSLDEVFGETRH